MSDLKTKRMSYAASFKLKAVKAAEETSNLEAARNFEVDENNIRRWRKDSTLDCTPNSKPAKKGPKAGQFPEMKKNILEWFESKAEWLQCV